MHVRFGERADEAVEAALVAAQRPQRRRLTRVAQFRLERLESGAQDRMGADLDQACRFPACAIARTAGSNWTVWRRLYQNSASIVSVPARPAVTVENRGHVTGARLDPGHALEQLVAQRLYGR